LYKQKNQWGFIFGIYANEKDFLTSGNENKLKSLFQRMERIRFLVGANQATYAGILPSLLVSRGIIRADESVERKTTVAAVLQAIEQVKVLKQIADETPVIVLGGSGFIGSRLLESNNGNNFYPLDIGGRVTFSALVKKFSGQPMIILNLTKKGVLSEYIPFFHPGVVVINEVYPEPSRAEVASIKNKGASCYNIAGLSAGISRGDSLLCFFFTGEGREWFI
jgi:hypothetical protein